MPRRRSTTRLEIRTEDGAGAPGGRDASIPPAPRLALPLRPPPATTTCACASRGAASIARAGNASSWRRAPPTRVARASRRRAASSGSGRISTRCAAQHNWGFGDFGDLGALLRTLRRRRRGLRRREPAARDSEPRARDHAVLAVEPPLPQRALPRRRGGARVGGVPGRARTRRRSRVRRAARGVARRRRDRPRRRARREAARAARSLRDLLRAARGRRERAERAFAAFVRREGTRLRDFATWEALAAHFAERRQRPATAWRRWPLAYQRPDGAAVAAFREAHAAEIEFRRGCSSRSPSSSRAPSASGRDAGLAIGLYQDLAVGSAGDSADTWMAPALFATGASVGAPPDDYAPEGQNWGFPPLDPHALRADGYRFFAAMLRANFASAGALRIDHAMGLDAALLDSRGPPGARGHLRAIPATTSSSACSRSRAGAMRRS